MSVFNNQAQGVAPALPPVPVPAPAYSTPPPSDPWDTAAAGVFLLKHYMLRPSASELTLCCIVEETGKLGFPLETRDEYPRGSGNFETREECATRALVEELHCVVNGTLDQPEYTPRDFANEELFTRCKEHKLPHVYISKFRNRWMTKSRFNHVAEEIRKRYDKLREKRWRCYLETRAMKHVLVKDLIHYGEMLSTFGDECALPPIREVSHDCTTLVNVRIPLRNILHIVLRNDNIRLILKGELMKFEREVLNKCVDEREVNDGSRCKEGN